MQFSERLATLLRRNIGKCFCGEMGRYRGSVRASGSQQVQNKLLVLAGGNCLHVSDASNSYLGTFSMYSCQPKSLLMQLAI